MRCKAVDSATMYKYVRFITGRDKGQHAKIVCMNLGRLGNALDDITINVVVYLDGHNDWNYLESVADETVEIVDGVIALSIVDGQVDKILPEAREE